MLHAVVFPPPEDPKKSGFGAPDVADGLQTGGGIPAHDGGMTKRDRTLIAFGRNVARIREQKGLTQDSLAEKADLDRTYLSGIERGVRNPGIKTVLRLARALEVSVGKLVEGGEV